MFFGFFNKDFIYLFLEGKERRKRERNIIVRLPLTCPLQGTWPATQACVLTGNQTSDPLVRSPVLSPEGKRHGALEVELVLLREGWECLKSSSQIRE